MTTCTFDAGCILGDVVDGRVVLTDFGEIATECWRAVAQHFENAEVDTFVVMPNHVHAIVVLSNHVPQSTVGATHASPLRAKPIPCEHTVAQYACGPEPGSLGAIVGSAKSASSRRINRLKGTVGAPVWQRNYHEHVIRDEEVLHRIRRYIRHNPNRWESDPENPSHL